MDNLKKFDRMFESKEKQISHHALAVKIFTAQVKVAQKFAEEYPKSDPDRLLTMVLWSAEGGISEATCKKEFHKILIGNTPTEGISQMGYDLAFLDSAYDQYMVDEKGGDLSFGQTLWEFTMDEESNPSRFEVTNFQGIVIDILNNVHKFVEAVKRNNGIC